MNYRRLSVENCAGAPHSRPRPDWLVSASVTDALFVADGDRFVPSEFTRGPWRPDAQHGGPPAALLGFCTEPHVGTDEFVSHIDVQLVRPVPLEPVRVVTTRRRASGRVFRIGAEMLADDQIVARSDALVLRRSEIGEPGWREDTAAAVDPPSEDLAVDPPRWASGGLTAYHRNAVEHRITDGAFGEPGPAVDWIRLRLPVVLGHDVTWLQRTLAAADFGSGISAVYGSDSRFGLINANLTVSVHRAAVGEWISLDARTDTGSQGTGLCISRLGDLQGRFGVATQSLLGFSVG